MLHALNSTILRTDVLILAPILIYTGISISEEITQLVEVAPVIIVVPSLLATIKQYPLTPLLYTLIFLHVIILIVDGMYIYVKVLIGFQVQEWLDLSHNPYDKLGHFLQGLVSTLTAGEALVHGNIVCSRKIPSFLICCVVLAISTMYELIKWWAALAMGQSADDFLSAQGDLWDTQSGMFCVLLGALTTVPVLTGWHSWQLKTVGGCQHFSNNLRHLLQYLITRIGRASNSIRKLTTLTAVSSVNNP